MLFTVTLQVAVLPLKVLAVMVQVPAFLAETTPLLLTVAIALLLVLQVTFLLSAEEGLTVALRVKVVPAVMVRAE